MSLSKVIEFYHIDEKKPEYNQRILAISPVYPPHSHMRLRLVSWIINLEEVKWWAPLENLDDSEFSLDDA